MGLAWSDLLTAFALLLVLEGLLPFAVPGAWRRMMTQASEMDDRQLRVAGAVLMAIGLVFLSLAR